AGDGERAVRGRGVVYRVRDPSLDREVALKLLRADPGADPDGSAAARALLLREARSLARLTHPNVIAIHEVGEHEGEVFLAMELVDGEPLRAWMTARPGWRAVVRALAGAGGALAAAHRAGIVHRDVKPDNVLCGRDGRARLVDFGLARAAAGAEGAAAAGAAAAGGGGAAAASGSELTRAGALVGTLPYMAPEQLRCAPADARSDQFAFFVSLYEALFGQRPFRGAAPEELLAVIVSGP